MRAVPDSARREVVERKQKGVEAQGAPGRHSNKLERNVSGVLWEGD